MRPIVTDGVVWYVCLSVSLLQSWTLQNSWSDLDAIWDVDCAGPKEPCIIWGSRTRSCMHRGNFYGEKRCLLGEQGRLTILLKRNLNFGETLKEVHFSCSWLCWKVTKYDMHILWLTVSVYELFEPPCNLIVPLYPKSLKCCTKLQFLCC